jgi:hypothetical protein
VCRECSANVLPKHRYCMCCGMELSGSC